ncbi:MAG: hypothetical protein WCI45_12310, partial [Desulfuromonadales bacterium]
MSLCIYATQTIGIKVSRKKIKVCIGVADLTCNIKKNNDRHKEQILKTINLFISCVLVLTLFAPFNARSEESKQVPLNSLLGKYEGRMQVHNAWQQENDYQTEIISVD